MSDSRPPPRRGALWYEEGLRFECTRCGSCCSGGGYVEVSDPEIDALAGHLGESRDVFLAQRTRPMRRGGIRLGEKNGGDCVFLERGRAPQPGADCRQHCGVYGSRPRQCLDYPFWPSILYSAETWQQESERCPGIGHGPLVGERELRQRESEAGRGL